MREGDWHPPSQGGSENLKTEQNARSRRVDGASLSPLALTEIASSSAPVFSQAELTAARMREGDWHPPSQGGSENLKTEQNVRAAAWTERACPHSP